MTVKDEEYDYLFKGKFGNFTFRFVVPVLINDQILLRFHTVADQSATKSC